MSVPSGIIVPGTRYFQMLFLRGFFEGPADKDDGLFCAGGSFSRYPEGLAGDQYSEGFIGFPHVLFTA